MVLDHYINYLIGIYWVFGILFSFNGLALVIIKIKYGKKGGKIINLFLYQVLFNPIVNINYQNLNNRFTEIEIKNIRYELKKRWLYLIIFAIVNTIFFRILFLFMSK